MNVQGANQIVDGLRLVRVPGVDTDRVLVQRWLKARSVLGQDTVRDTVAGGSGAVRVQPLVLGRRINVQPDDTEPGLALRRDLSPGIAQEPVGSRVVDDDATTAGECVPSTGLGDLMRFLPFLARYALPSVEAALCVDDIKAEYLSVEA